MIVEKPFEERDITLSIDNNVGTAPWLRWKENGDPLYEWRLKHITEHGNLWLPFEFAKNSNL